MQQTIIYIIVRWLNPVIGRYIGTKSGKQFSEEQIKDILSKQYPEWWDIFYVLLILGYLGISIFLWFVTLFILSRWYINFHNLPLNTPVPQFLNIVTIMLLFFLYLFWVSLIYFTLVVKLVSRKFYNYILMRQVKGGFAMSLEDTGTLILRLSIIATVIALPIIAYIFLT